VVEHSPRHQEVVGSSIDTSAGTGREIMMKKLSMSIYTFEYLKIEDRETERQRGREAERQRDRETGNRERDREMLYASLARKFKS
jgi:hypothetical protein